VVTELARRGEPAPIIAVTGQHRSLLDQVNEVFGIIPDFDLNVFADRQSLEGITTRVLDRLDPVLKQVCPAAVLVQGPIIRYNVYDKVLHEMATIDREWLHTLGRGGFVRFLALFALYLTPVWATWREIGKLRPDAHLGLGADADDGGVLVRQHPELDRHAAAAVQGRRAVRLDARPRGADRDRAAARAGRGARRAARAEPTGFPSPVGQGAG
jgi:hypothetical protein